MEKKACFARKLNIKMTKPFLFIKVFFHWAGYNVLIEAFNKRDEENAVMIFMGYGELEDQVKEASKNTKNFFCSGG